VTDVAWAVVHSLESPATIDRQFNISGAEPLTYNEVVRVTAQALGRRSCRLHIPAQLMVGLLDVMERSGITLPIKAEQIRRLNEDKAFSYVEAQEVFGYSPIAFEEGIRNEVALFLAGRDGLSS
jgi:nucleoside-diphosphate-sugar epimerase